jgi:hypothetical protein
MADVSVFGFLWCFLVAGLVVDASAVDLAGAAAGAAAGVAAGAAWGAADANIGAALRAAMAAATIIWDFIFTPGLKATP